MSATTATVPGKPRVTSSKLFGHGDRILIEHGGVLYLLRRCRGGGLLLTRWDGDVPADSSTGERSREARPERPPAGLFGRIWLRN